MCRLPGGSVEDMAQYYETITRPPPVSAVTAAHRRRGGARRARAGGPGGASRTLVYEAPASERGSPMTADPSEPATFEDEFPEPELAAREAPEADAAEQHTELWQQDDTRCPSATTPTPQPRGRRRAGPRGGGQTRTNTGDRARFAPGRQASAEENLVPLGTQPGYPKVRWPARARTVRTYGTDIWEAA